MQSILFYMPAEVLGLPLFGFGILFAVWAVVALITVVRLARGGWNADATGTLVVLGIVGLVVTMLLPALVEEGRGIPIRGYGLMLLIAVVAGVALSVYRGMQRGVDPEIVFSLAFWMFGAGIVGARAFYVVEYWEKQFHKETIGATVKAVLNVSQGGLVVYGSLFGACLAAVIFFRKHRLPILALADIVAPGMILGLAIGRIGCFLNGCCYGGQCELPWAVTFPYGSPPYARQVERGDLALHGMRFRGNGGGPAIIDQVEPGSAAEEAGLKSGDVIELLTVARPGQKALHFDVATLDDALIALLKIDGAGTTIGVKAERERIAVWTLPELPRSLPVHPTQLYSAIDAALLCLFLLAWTPFQRRDGEIIALLLTIHPLSRFLLEIIRTDEGPVFGTALSISQNISLALLAAAIGLWVYLLRQPPGKWRPAAA